MKSLSNIRGKLAFGLAFAIVLLVPSLASAASVTSSGNGLRISPVRKDLTINPGSSQDVTIYAENVTDSPAEFQVIVNDFTASNNENGTPDIILNPNQYAAQHSLKRFVATPPDFTLAPHEQKAVSVKISVPAGTAGGGYYGVVRFLPINVGNSSKSVSVAASVGTLVLLKVPGNLDENLSVASFNVSKNANSDSGSSWFTSGSGLYAVVRFTNNGNIQEAPFGKIVLKDGNKVLASYEINNVSPPGDVLPGSTRRFSIPLKNVGWGKYTVEGNFGYGTSGQLLSVSKTFYVVPLALIIAAIVVIILIILGIILARKEMRRHDRKLLAKFRNQSAGPGKRRR